jgi:hypothetical protein
LPTQRAFPDCFGFLGGPRGIEGDVRYGGGLERKVGALWLWTPPLYSSGIRIYPLTIYI